MISSISVAELRNQKMSMLQANNVSKVAQSPASSFTGYSLAASNALKANSISKARTIQFTGALAGAFEDLNQSMVTCKTKDNDGESVGSRANVNKLLHDFAGDFYRPDDAIKTTIQIDKAKLKNEETGKEVTVPVLARTQMKLVDSNNDSQTLLFQMAVREPDAKKTGYGVKSEKLRQNIKIALTPINYKGEGTHEQAYVLNTKGKLMAVVEDGNDVLLTNAGKLSKTDASTGRLEIIADEVKNTYKPFVPAPQAVVARKPMPSIGDGTEIVIGMEKGRFTKEIMASIDEFVRKIEAEEIVLPQFVAAPNAKNTQLIMLAGGFGSRAEYTNASSSAIFHDKKDGAQSTKGVFRTATGLTPMETTFVTLHKAGLLDCSKGKIGIGKNIRFYLNEGQNRGNGEFSADLYTTMPMDGRKSAIIFPNDSMSRMTEAVIEANKLIGSGKAAIAMVAKKVKAEDCIKNFGIIKYDPTTKQILGFAEKPSKEELYGKYRDFIDKDGMCVTNTFQFAVSDEAFRVLDMFEDYFVFKPGEKESRDWSKQYIPIIKTLTEETDYNVIRQQLAKSLGNVPENIPDSIIAKAQAILGDQKMYTVPTSEPWADCGTLNQLYHTTMQIVSGDFPLEDFERAHALECVDTSTGLIASSKVQKERIASKYTINGQVMVVPQARAITYEEVQDIPVTIHRD
ncbi:MAG: hypothetical protein IKL52_04675 [Candidatus Gastranaerophilales bacterium]|nr:hypothetical protein [Candidatus Gastranaerophilales bacterium]